MNSILLAAVILAASHDDTIPTDTVSVIEKNHFYDENRERTFTQAIFRDWNAAEHQHDVAAWMLWNDGPLSPHRIGTDLIFIGGRGLVRIRAASFRETWTQYDPELQEREILPRDMRRGLFGRPPRRPSPQDEAQ